MGFSAVDVSPPTVPNPAGGSAPDPGSPADWSSSTVSGPVWRSFCDALHGRLISAWVGEMRFRSALKTDLFDEAAGCGVVGRLRSVAGEVRGVDISDVVVSRAASRNPGLIAERGDVRALRFRDGEMDFIFSNSTLDHFPTEGEIATSLRELARVLSPGGRMIITLDNPENPVVALRNGLPCGPLMQAGLVPYYIGKTLPMRGLCRALRDTGLELLDASHVMHVPRVVALHLCRFVPGESRWSSRLVRMFLSFEAAARWPTARFTGHFSAALVRKSP